MKDIRRAYRDEILRAIGAEPASPGASQAPREGLFPPGSIVRRVHGDVASMMIGGVGSLLLQMLHPSALAGVWDHSDYRRDMPGRLRRTARFVSVTTYGARDDALAAIGRVRSIHGRVTGSLPDGSAYEANDPELLTWVHVAEVWSFLKAHLRYRDRTLSASAQDDYYAQMASVARLLGAENVPTTSLAVTDYLESMRPQLRWDRRTRRVAQHLLSQPAVTPALAPFNALVMSAGADLLPDWAKDMHGLGRRPRQERSIRVGALGAGVLLRWAMSVDARQS